MLLAQVQVDPAREQPAERLVHDAERLVVGRRARHADATRRAAASAARPACRRARAAPRSSPGCRASAAAGVPCCQSPNAFSTSGRSSAAVIWPDTTSAALFGTKFCDQNALQVVARHRLVRRLGAELGVAVRVRRSRRAPPPSRAAPPAPGFSRCCTRLARRLARCRSTSSAGKLGLPRHVRHQRRAAPGSSAAATLRSTCDRVHRRRRAERRRRAARPRRRSAARCASPCPSSSIAAVKLARPGLSAGFAPLPVFTTRFAETIGRPGRSLTSTVRPFGSWNDVGVGNLQRLAPRPGLRRVLAPRLVGIDRLGAGARRRLRRLSASARARRDPAVPGTPCTTTRVAGVEVLLRRTPSPTPASTSR